MSGDDLNELRVGGVPAEGALHVEKPSGMPGQPGQSGGHQPRRERDEAKDHFEQLANTAELANKALLQEQSRYRFCIYRKGEDVYIDVVILDENGEVASIVQKEITHEDFARWLAHIEEEEGLVLDKRA